MNKCQVENICDKSDKRQTEMDNLIQANFLPNQMEAFGTIPDFYTKFHELATDPVPVASISRTDVEKKLGFKAPPILDNFVPNLEFAAVERNLCCENINEYASQRVENRQQQNGRPFQYSPISDAGSSPLQQSLESLIVQEVLQLEEQQETMYSPISNGEKNVESLIVEEVLKLEEQQQRNNSSDFGVMNPVQGNSTNTLLQNVSYPQQQITAMHSPISDATWPPAQQQIVPPTDNTNLKRPRTTYKSSQVERMEEYCRSKGYYVSKSEREKLAEELNLRPQQVKVWFQNRRAKQRRLNSMCPYQRYPQCYAEQYPFIQNVCCNDESCLSNYAQMPCCPQLPQKPRLPQVEMTQLFQKPNNDEKNEVTLETLDSDSDLGPPLQVPDFEVFN